MGESVFKFGDYGDKFYVILEGKVSVLAPVKGKKPPPKTKFQQKMTIKNFEMIKS